MIESSFERKGDRIVDNLLSGGLQWFKFLPRLVSLVDAFVIIIAMLTAQIARFGIDADAEIAAETLDSNYWTISVVLALVWWVGLGSSGSRAVRVLGTGIGEYKAVVLSTVYFFGGIAIVSYALQLNTARGYVGIALPLGVVLLVIGRWSVSKWLKRNRKLGKFSRNVLLVGSPSAVEHLRERLQGSVEAGYKPTALVLPGYSLKSPTGMELPLPVISVSSDAHEILRAIDKHQIDVVAISAGTNLKPRQIRELGWELHARNISMVMAPALTDIAGPRIHTQPVAGLPLIHVSTPRLVGFQAALKRGFDISGALIFMVLLSPACALVALAIKLDSTGPVFYRQERVGTHEIPFRMHKFRSMSMDADKHLDHLVAVSNGNGVLFKMKDDPRVTTVGAFIRRYSIDELPQLWNVLVGNMSMVGPRPPLKSEVDLYERYVERRLLVKPGITGLWQVSGRSDLTWEESVRLDLFYVENWSLIQDMTILVRTVKAVLSKTGAY
ncbi:sugar transferase [Glutamicibacter arilaitensis]|uniref:sugar transferase n=1 Tax=Glutamicibacter arilaitensis TaxID=256701 RepID=UPI003FD07798